MAIYHLKVTTGSKLKGASGTIRCDYITRQGAYADREEELVLAESGNLPPWASDERHFWEAADTYERKNGRVYNEVEVALPRELPRERQIELAREFVSDLMTPSRLPYTMAIHDSDGHNPHMHVIYSERGDDGVAREMEQHFRRANTARPWKGGAPKDTSMRGSEWVKQVRKDWEIAANVALERAGESARVDCRSYRERRIARTPQLHLGVAAAAMLRRGVEVDRVASYVRIEKIRQIEEELERLRTPGREEVEETEVEADEGVEASMLSSSPLTKAGEIEPVSEPGGEARDRSIRPRRLPLERPAGQGRGAAERPSSTEVSPGHQRDLTGDAHPILSQGVGGGGAPDQSSDDLGGASDHRELALSVMKAALDRAPKDATWKDLADGLKQSSVALVPEGTQGDYGMIRGLYFEYEGVRLPASEVDGEASYGQLSSVLGTLERSHLGDVCRVVAIAGRGDVHVLIAKRRAALAPEKTGPELELPGFVDRDYKGAREKFEEKLAASRARSVEEGRKVKVPEDLNRPGFIDRVYRGPKEKFLDELARYEAGEMRARRGPDSELEARLPGFVDRVYKGPKEKFQEDLRAAGLDYPGDKSGEGELARGVIEAAQSGERGSALAGVQDAEAGVSYDSSRGKEAVRDERERDGERGREETREDGLRRPGFKEFTPVGASEKLLREVKERLGEDAYQRALDARRAIGSSEGGKLEDAIGEVERVVSARERTADEELIARVGGKDLLAGMGKRAPEEDRSKNEPVKGSREFPFTKREVDARIRATGKLLVDVARQPFVGRVRETFDTKAWGRVALIEGEDRVTMMKAREDDPRFVPGNVIASTPGERGVQVRSVAKGTRENPYTRHEIQARVAHITANKPLADVSREPFKGHVKDAFYDERGDRIAVLEGPNQVALVKVSPEDKRVRPDALAITTPTDKGLALSVHARGEKENPYSREEVDAMLARQTTPRLAPEDRRMAGQVQRAMQVNEVLVAREKGEVALVVDDKSHAVVPTAGLGDKLSRGEAVEVSASSEGVIKVARAEDRGLAGGALRPELTPGRGDPEPSVRQVGLSGEEVRAKVKAMAMGTEKCRPTAEPMYGKVVDKFVIDGKGEAVLVVGEKKHTIVLTRGNEDKLAVGEKVALSPDGKGGVRVEPVKVVEKSAAEQNKPTPTPLSERAQPVRGVEGKEDFKAVLTRVEAEAKLKAAAPSAIDRARPGKDGEPPAMDQRPTMKEWLKAQQEKGVEGSAPIERGVIRGKVEREPVYLKEGKHYVISEENGSKRLDASPKLEEHRGKQTRLMRAGKDDEMVSTLEVSRGRSR